MLPPCWQAVTAATVPPPRRATRRVIGGSCATGPISRASTAVLERPARRPRPRAGRRRRTTFDQAAGPFTSYRRTLTRVPDDGGDGGGRRRPIAGRCRGSPGSSPCPVRWAIARRGAAPTHPAHHHAAPTPWWAPPDRLDPRALTVLGLLAAASMSSAFVNTLFTQTVNFAADDFGVSDGGIGVGGADRPGRDHPRPAVRRARRPHRSSARRDRRWPSPPRWSPPPEPSPRRSRSSSPPRPSAARSGWPSTSSSPSSPPRRCPATAGPTPSACWRWPAGSAPGSP